MWAEIRVKRAQWPNAALAYLPTDLSTRARHQTLASLQAFPADRRSFMRSPLTVSVSAPSTATSWKTCGACYHAGDEQLQRPVVRPHRRAAAVRFAATVCYKRIVVDRAAGPDTVCAAVSVRHRRLSPGHLEGRQGEVGQRCGILLAWTSCCVVTGCSSSTLSTPVRKWNSSG